MISVDVSFIVIFIIIWILVYVLTKTFFNPVRRVMTEREIKIQKNRESSEKTIEAYEQSISEIEEDLKAAKDVSDTKREELEKEALSERNRLLGEIKAECRSQVEKAREQLKRQMKSLKKELESETEVLAERIEKRLLH